MAPERAPAACGRLQHAGWAGALPAPRAPSPPPIAVPHLPGTAYPAAWHPCRGGSGPGGLSGRPADWACGAAGAGEGPGRALGQIWDAGGRECDPQGAAQALPYYLARVPVLVSWPPGAAGGNHSIPCARHGTRRWGRSPLVYPPPPPAALPLLDSAPVTRAAASARCRSSSGPRWCPRWQTRRSCWRSWTRAAWG